MTKRTIRYCRGIGIFDRDWLFVCAGGGSWSTFLGENDDCGNLGDYALAGIPYVAGDDAPTGFVFGGDVSRQRPFIYHHRLRLPCLMVWRSGAGRMAHARAALWRDDWDLWGDAAVKGRLLPTSSSPFSSAPATAKTSAKPAISSPAKSSKPTTVVGRLFLLPKLPRQLHLPHMLCRVV